MKILAPSAAAVAMFLAADASFAAEPCPATVGTPGNPAFGAPRPCPTTSTTPSAQARGRKADAVTTTPDGRRLYRYGDTTISVGGSVSVDFGTARGGSTR